MDIEKFRKVYDKQASGGQRHYGFFVTHADYPLPTWDYVVWLEMRLTQAESELAQMTAERDRLKTDLGMLERMQRNPPQLHYTFDVDMTEVLTLLHEINARLGLLLAQGKEEKPMGYSGTDQQKEEKP